MSSQSVNIDLQRSGNKVGKTVIPSPNDSRRKQETTYVTIETFALKMKFLKKKKIQNAISLHKFNFVSFISTRPSWYRICIYASDSLLNNKLLTKNILFSMRIIDESCTIHWTIRYFWKQWISNFSNFSYEVWSIWGYHHKQHTPPHIRKHKHT